jgi:hypothetical protein
MLDEPPQVGCFIPDRRREMPVFKINEKMF